MKLIISLLVTTIAILVAANVIPGVQVVDTTTAVVLAVVLGILNTFLKPVLQILALPITILTLGLFYLVINVLIIFFAEYLVKGFTVDGFIPALLFGFVVSIVSGILSMILD